MEEYCIQDEEESLLSVSYLRSVLSVLILLSSVGLLTGIVTGNADFVFGFGGLCVLSFAEDLILWFCDQCFVINAFVRCEYAVAYRRKIKTLRGIYKYLQNSTLLAKKCLTFVCFCGIII